MDLNALHLRSADSSEQSSRPQRHVRQWLHGFRPLSDIRETTEPSLRHLTAVSNSNQFFNHGQTNSKAFARDGVMSEEDAVASAGTPATAFINQETNPHPLKRQGTERLAKDSIRKNQEVAESLRTKTRKRSSIYIIPYAYVPPRSTSKYGIKHRVSFALWDRVPRIPGGQAAQKPLLKPTSFQQQHSPMKSFVDNTATESSGLRPYPPKTIVRFQNQQIDEILVHPTHMHHRIKLGLQITAPFFVGGSPLRGSIRIVVDDAANLKTGKSLTLERATVDLLGIEELFGAKRHVFLALANELVDTTYPPPTELLEMQDITVQHGRSWVLVPCIARLPFLITLPLDVGPPPFKFKSAQIRYVLSATLIVKETGRQLYVRSSQEITLLPNYDPKKALMSLPSPLTASDEYLVPSANNNSEVLHVTAGLHRQVWIGGTSIFTDVYIANNTKLGISRIELQLERVILCYRHAAAATLEASASNARLFNELERTIVCKHLTKAGKSGWTGVAPRRTETRICELEIPRGHTTVKCYRYLEVRYFLNVIAGTAHRKLVCIQLPIQLIHMSSLNLPTNALATILGGNDIDRKQKLASRFHPPRYRNKHKLSSSKAFLAPRSSRYELRGGTARPTRSPSCTKHALPRDISELSQALEDSPRKYGHALRRRRLMPQVTQRSTARSKRTGWIVPEEQRAELNEQLRGVRSEHPTKLDGFHDKHGRFAKSCSVRKIAAERQIPKFSTAKSTLKSRFSDDTEESDGKQPSSRANDWPSRSHSSNADYQTRRLLDSNESMKQVHIGTRQQA